jgi:hypothetical protein
LYDNLVVAGVLIVFAIGIGMVDIATLLSGVYPVLSGVYPVR